MKQIFIMVYRFLRLRCRYCGRSLKFYPQYPGYYCPTDAYTAKGPNCGARKCFMSSNEIRVQVALGLSKIIGK